MSISDPPEFGPNGSVLNSENISSKQAKQYRESNPFEVSFEPKIWPLSALILAVSGVFMFGFHIGSDRGSASLAISMSLFVSGLIWREVWSHYFRK